MNKCFLIEYIYIVNVDVDFDQIYEISLNQHSSNMLKTILSDQLLSLSVIFAFLSQKKKKCAVNSLFINMFKVWMIFAITVFQMSFKPILFCYGMFTFVALPCCIYTYIFFSIVVYWQRKSSGLKCHRKQTQSC